MARPIGIDLFAGAGGLSLAFEQAGFDVAAAVEIDPIHAAVHKFNFPHCATLARSVVGLSGSTIREAASLQGRTIDVVFGGAPCQGFSLIGHRAIDDPRNSLVREYVRLVVELDASYFVFENVKGLTVGRHLRFLTELIQTFWDNGYAVRDPWEVLNASRFGAPQDRERLFLLGAKIGRAIPTYPRPLTVPAYEADKPNGLPTGPSCRDALSDLPEVEEYDELIEGDSVRIERWGMPSAYARELRCLTNDVWHYGYPRVWDPSVLTSSMRTDHTEISRRRFGKTAPGSVEPISRFYRLAPNGVSNTLRAGTDAARGAFTSPRPIHYERRRCITVREMARLHGFPDWFRFHETKWHGARQIGNAVPPPLGRAVAQQIRKALSITPRRPSKIIALGDPTLLQIGMAQAAEYWGVRNPIMRRDRKSGATKRTQAEIESLRLTAE